MKYYLAGPMTGIPQFNYPAFDEAAKFLRASEYDVVSPAELDDPETRRMAMSSPDGALGSGCVNDETWGDFLSRDVKLIADECKGVIVLPGWEKSRGARLEVFVALLCGYEILRYLPSIPVVIATDRDEVLEVLHQSMVGVTLSTL